MTFQTTMTLFHSTLYPLVIQVSWNFIKNFANLESLLFIIEVLKLFNHNYAFFLLFITHCKVASVLSDSLWPYGLQPSRILCPWDSPGTCTDHMAILHWSRGWTCTVHVADHTPVTWHIMNWSRGTRQEHWSGLPFPSPTYYRAPFKRQPLPT